MGLHLKTPIEMYEGDIGTQEVPRLVAVVKITSLTSHMFIIIYTV